MLSAEPMKDSRQVIDGVRDFVARQGLDVLGVVDSPLPGPAGNVEALLAARKDSP